jgi:hypothetical protein
VSVVDEQAGAYQETQAFRTFEGEQAALQQRAGP